MRCIGVTTTLDPAAMQQEGPTLVRPSIADIRLHDIQTLGMDASPSSASPVARHATVCDMRVRCYESV